MSRGIKRKKKEEKKRNSAFIGSLPGVSESDSLSGDSFSCYCPKDRLFRNVD